MYALFGQRKTKAKQKTLEFWKGDKIWQYPKCFAEVWYKCLDAAAYHILEMMAVDSGLIHHLQLV